jgi:hypothetical protein
MATIVLTNHYKDKLPGEQIDVTDDVARQLIKGGYARPVEADSPESGQGDQTE